MVCCANYWAAHGVDAAGRVGVTLQKILFLLSALTAVTVLSCEPLTILGAGVALLVYAVGIHGAQKRKHRALFFYGAVSLASLIMSLVAAAFIAGFLLFGGLHLHRPAAAPQHAPKAPFHGVYNQGMFAAMGQHAHASFMDKMHEAGVVAPVLVPTKGQTDDGTEFELVDIKKQQQPVVLDLAKLEFPNKKSMQSSSDDVAAAVSSSDEVALTSEEEQPSAELEDDAHGGAIVHTQVRLTAFGWAVVVLGLVVSFVMLALKIKSIRLAFCMRRMLLANMAASLPTTAPRGAVQMATVPTNVRPPTGPAPSVRRDCSRCTYVNAVGAVRCAMCDSALPIAVAAPAAAPAPVPRVYVPGSLYPLNQPLN